MENLALITQKIIKQENLPEILTQWKAKKQVLVFTNGCFDILHLGHVDYLSKAKDLGDKLIIGLNSDKSVKRLKGETRPINNEKTRATILAALQFVDAIIVFEEDTPENLIHKINPNILVKGGDYNIETIVGADFVIKNGGSVEIIPLVKGFSTTNLLNYDK